jgi:hypothetical protein
MVADVQRRREERDRRLAEKEEMCVCKRREVGATKKKESRGQKSGEGQAQIFTAGRQSESQSLVPPNPRASFGPGAGRSSSLLISDMRP